MLIIYKINNRHPRITVIHIVAKAWGVNDGQLDLELFLFKFGFDDLDFGELVELFFVTTTVVARRRKLGGEECVDECRFTETRLA